MTNEGAVVEHAFEMSLFHSHAMLPGQVIVGMEDPGSHLHQAV